MIAFVRGRVAVVGLTSAVLEVGGVGLELQCTPNTLAELRTGSEAMLPTSLVVREDSMMLFGFGAVGAAMRRQRRHAKRKRYFPPTFSRWH